MQTEFSNHPHKLSSPMYRVICKEVYDGDTYTMLVDCGFYSYIAIRVRLKGYNAAEVKTKDLAEKEQGFKARDRVKELILDKPCVIMTYKDTMSFDRWVADVFYFTDSGLAVDLGKTLLDENLVEVYTK